MKPRRIIALCLLLSTLLTSLLALSACKPRVVEITRFETDPGKMGEPNVRASFRIFEQCLDVYSHYYFNGKRVGRVFLPQEGEFVTADGERFVATVRNSDMYYGISDGSYTTTVRFTLGIYTPEGTLIMERQISSSSNHNFEQIPEEIVCYWDAVKIAPEELFCREKEVE